MQQKLQQFIFLSERILVEPGELLLRPTWKELQAISKDLSPYMKKLTFSFEPKYAFLFLLSCGSDSPQRNGCLSMLLRKTLESVPSREVMNVLSSVPRVDLNTYLLPFLYEKGVIGSVAAFTAAKLGLKVKFDAFEFFLDSREWNQIDLFNLSFLVLNDEKSVLINQLRAARKQSFTDFANVLESQTTQGTNPVMPELKASKQEIPNVEQTQNQTQKTSSKIEENNIGNSMGSVIPVKKDVKPADIINDLVLFLFSLLALLYIAKHTAGKANIIIGNEPVKYCAYSLDK